MPEIAREGDPISCGDIINEGSGNVFAEGMPITRITSDLTAGHCFAPTQIETGSTTVFVNGKGVARKTDPIVQATHFCVVPPNNHPGIIVSGASKVFADGA